MGDQGKQHQGKEEDLRRPSPDAPQPPAHENTRRAGAEAAEERLGPSTEGDVAPETKVSMESGPQHAQYHSYIPPGFSLVVNDVDAESTDDRRGNTDIKTTGFEEEILPPSESELKENVSNKDSTTEKSSNRTLSHSSSQKELSDARIKQIQGEVESRRNEFARLLEEHAQVVMQLKAMEEEENGNILERQQTI